MLLELKLKKIYTALGIIGIIISLRLFFLTTVATERYEKLSRRPKYKTVFVEPLRGTIRDRFNEVLVTNKISYSVGIMYEDLLSIPRIRWKTNGKTRTRTFPRKEYTEKLARFLAGQFDVDPTDIVDLIYSQAAIFPSMFFTVYEAVDEQTYYKLRFLEKEWPGLRAKIFPVRHYPEGTTASSVLGYLGKMDFQSGIRKKEELSRLLAYMQDVEELIPSPLPAGFTSQIQVVERIHELQTDLKFVGTLQGKAGVERTFQADLAGRFGEKRFEIDPMGNTIRELPDSKNPVSGRRLFLTLAAQLQKHAEMILMQSDSERQKRFYKSSPDHKFLPRPWVCGGAIVAIEPTSGDILALASYPGFDPADFITHGKSSRRRMWLETPEYVRRLWDGLDNIPKPGSTPKKWTWKRFVHQLVAKGSDVDRIISSFSTLNLCIKADEEENPALSTQDRDLLRDLCAVLISKELAGPEFLGSFGTLSPDRFRSLEQAVITARGEVYRIAEKIFTRTDFPAWREAYFTHFLEQKRKEEKEKKSSQKPYTVYLEEAKEILFRPFFHQNRELFLEAFLTKRAGLQPGLNPFIQEIISKSLESSAVEIEALKQFLAEFNSEQVRAFFRACRSFYERDESLVGRYHFRQKPGKEQTEQDLILHAYPAGGCGFATSSAFQEASPLGSIFKIVTGYEAARQKIERDTGDPNPLVIVDASPPYSMSMKAGTVLGYTLSGTPICRWYKGGRLPRSHPNIGKIDLCGAFEKSSNLYFSLLAKDHLSIPTDLSKCAMKMGFGSPTRVKLDREATGKVPFDLFDNPSNLYSFAIGQHTLLTTPLQTAVMLSAFMNGGNVVVPRIALHLLNLEPQEKEQVLFRTEFAFREALKNMGIFFPLFTSGETGSDEPYVRRLHTEIQARIFLPEPLRRLILEGLYSVVNSNGGTARKTAIRTLHEQKELRDIYGKLAPFMIGKTSTAEKRIKPYLNAKVPAALTKDTWFVAGSFKEAHTFTSPELVVVVYLRYGDFGKECAPLAASMIDKYRSLLKVMK